MNLFFSRFHSSLCFCRFTRFCFDQKMSISNNWNKETKTEEKHDFFDIIRKCNNFAKPDSSRSKCFPFVVEGQQVGLIRPDIWQKLKSYTNIFRLEKTSSSSVVHLENLGNVQERSAKLDYLLQELRDKNVFRTLSGWRDERYDVRPSFSGPLLMDIERAAICLFGILAYGTHLNGYTYSEDGSLQLWVGKRSPTKQTWPGKLDNMVAGGLSSGLGLMECMRKECQEEASVPDNLLEKIIPVGHVSYFYEDERGLFPECQFVFDLEVPQDFVPKNADGEVADFQLVSMETLQHLITSEEFKPNCSLVTLDFLIRKGVITPDSEARYAELVELLRQPLQLLYPSDKILIDHNIPRLPKELNSI